LKRNESRRSLPTIASKKFLPRAYKKTLFEQKCERVYQHVYDSYAGSGRSINGKEMVI